MTQDEPWGNLPSHMTATGFVLNPERSKLLLVLHNRLGRWLPPGGHVEMNEAPSHTAIREVFEETGIVAHHRQDSLLDLKLTATDEWQLPNPLATSAQVIHGGDSQLDCKHVHIDMLFELGVSYEDAPQADVSEVADAQWFEKAQIVSQLNTFSSVRAYAQSRMIGREC